MYKMPVASGLHSAIWTSRHDAVVSHCESSAIVAVKADVVEMRSENQCYAIFMLRCIVNISRHT